MNLGTARVVLERYRPGMDVQADDAELRSALALAESDPELGRWFAGHCEFQREVVRRVRGPGVSDEQKARWKARMLEKAKEVPFPTGMQAGKMTGRTEPGRRWAVWQALAVAAALVLLIGGGLYWKGSGGGESGGFANFRQRMVRSALREYRMDIRSTELAAVRDFMSKGGAPADFEIPGGLGQMPLAGGGLLTWRGRPVSMICYGKGAAGMSYLFVMRKDGVADVPSLKREMAVISGRSSVSWSRGDHVYLLMGGDGVNAESLL